MADEIRFDRLMQRGGEHVARQLGGGEVWEAGLGKLCSMAIEAAGVPSSPMSIDEVRSKIQLSETQANALSACAGIARLFLPKRV